MRLPGTRLPRLLPLACASIALAAAAGAQPAPDVVLTGEIDDSAHESYRLVPFEVPEGTVAITVELDYTGREARTTIDIGLLGPDGFHGVDGFRGWSGGSKRSFTVAAADATPSYLPGPLTPGTWNLLLGVPNIRRGERAELEARIYFARAETPTESDYGPTVREEPGWYRGDLHLHSGHSDGTCDSFSGDRRVPCPLFLTLAAAAERGLDFVAVTEHNTISHVRELTALQPYFDELLLIPGMEVTTFQGHANVIGVTRPIDFRVGSRHVPYWNNVLAEIESRGATVSINHPNVPSGEVCMGCGWNPSDAVDYSRIHAVEVINGNDVETLISGISFWHARLDEGLRLTAIGGSDTHDVTAEALSHTGRVGVPATVVHARELSVAGIQEGLRNGNVFIDVEGSRGRHLEMTARAASVGGAPAVPMGGELRLSRGEEAEVSVHVAGVPDPRLEVIRDGRVIDLLPSHGGEGSGRSWTFRETGRGERSWIRVNVRDARGRLLLVGNPIYFEPRAKAAR